MVIAEVVEVPANFTITYINPRVKLNPPTHQIDGLTLFCAHEWVN